MLGLPRTNIWSGRLIDANERFLSKAFPEPNSGCWLWDGPTDGKGYGFFKFQNRSVRAHRYSYELHKGPIPFGLMIDHKCCNRTCVNPSHLEVVTAKENADRTVARGRHQHATKTHCRNGHPYAGDNLVLVNGERRCRACLNRNARAYIERRRAAA